MNKIKYALISLAVLILAAVGLFDSPKQADAGSLVRISGADRYETSVKISQNIYPLSGSAKSVVIVSGETFADALAASPLAKAADGPVLLTRKNKTPDSVVSEIFRLLPNPQFTQHTIYVLGGTAVINKGQMDWLASQGYKIVRLAGANRMETSVKAAEKADVLRGTAPDRAYIVNGYGFADGIAVGSLATSENRNILLTENGDLSQVVRDYVNANIDTLADVTLVGGTAVLPQSIADLFTSNGFGVVRIAGANRYATAVEIAKRLSGVEFGLASGKNFPDGLAAGYFLSLRSAPLLLEQGVDCGDTHKYIDNNSSKFSDGYVFGGTSVVSSAAAKAASDLMNGIKTC